jgi:hypothetical protein
MQGGIDPMFRFVIRPLAAATVTLGAMAALAVPALAGQGQAYPAPGFPSGNAACVGTALDFGSHYGTDGSSFPVVEHGGVGPAVSGHATNDAPGSVGRFDSTLAQGHGDIGTCLP